MAYFAELDENNYVIRTIVIEDSELLLNGVESEEKGISFCQSLYGANTKWKQTSHDKIFRVNFASTGFFYNEALDAFIYPQPYPSWILNLDNYQWEAPIPYPAVEEGSDEEYIWDENTTSWLLLPPSN